MKTLKTLRFIVGLFILIAVIVGSAAISHPIILKLITGSARLIGRPINATVYTNGRLNSDVQVFHVNKYWNGQSADYYILYFPYAENSRLRFLSLNRKDNFVGVPSSTNRKDYDIVAGVLLQSEVGAHFTPIQDSIKGFSYEPYVQFSDSGITLTMPPTARDLKSDSLRVVL
jgi:hypothetical protein